MRRRFMFWLWDGWPYEWKPLWFVRLSARIGCVFAGHEPVCNKHHRPVCDHCVWCRKPMPHQAHGGAR